MNGFDWSLYRGNLEWLPSHSIFITRHGSHAYGTNIATSDEDFRGVAIPPREYILGALQRFEQAECKDPDLTVFDLRKFISLAAQANPNVLEILHTDPCDHLLVTPLGERLLDSRELFLSKRVKHTFAGYAHAQLARINRHYRWIRKGEPPKKTRAEFGLPDRHLIPTNQLEAAKAAIKKKLDSWSATFLDDLDRSTRIAIIGKMTEHLAEIQVSMDDNAWIGAARTLGFTDNFIELLDRERRYDVAKKEWEHYWEWKKNRNPARAELEAKYGFDGKHAAHLVRLLRMCREILTTGQVIVKRPDAEELIAIRNGAWTYEQLIEWSNTENQALEELYKTSALPNAAPVHKLDALCIELVEQSLKG